MNSTQISYSYDSKTQLAVPIPQSLYLLSLSEHSLNRTIPSWLYSLPSLRYLFLRRNQLSGKILEFQSSSLTVLDLGFNKLHGVIPSSIFEIVNLQMLHLSSNNLSGALDFENFSKLRYLASIDLSFNHLSLSFSNSSDNTLPGLSYLALSSCNISEFPSFLSTLPNLNWLDLSHNRIQGNLWYNFLTATKQLPWKNLKYLDLRSNLLKGELPIPPPSIYFFSISNNQLTGELPPTICNLSSLYVFDLSHNGLSGKIHPCIGNFSRRLSVLDFRKNKFIGVIPSTFSKGNSLRNLGLNGNQLEGPLPPSLLTCRKLEVLDLGNNKINDSFPHWLESLPTLQVLVLRSNKFHGTIGISRTRLPFQKLRIMDLSENQFSGLLLVKYFENLMGMINLQDHELKYMGDQYYQDTVVVTIKGLDIEMVKIQTFFTTLDFSNNVFIGKIPNVIGKLKSLKGLNFSHNELTGPITPSFGNLINLEGLDISSNNLVGEIPMQLVDLTSLAKLNLSENQLMGSIPHGKQFDTFDNDSYSGNIGLCGSPLSKTCISGSAHQPPRSLSGQEDGFDWKIVLMGYGCGVVIGISIGYLVISNAIVDRLVIVVGTKQ